MLVGIDHLFIPAEDRKKSAEFYAKILGFEDLGERPPPGHLHPVRVNDSTVLLFINTSERDSPFVKGKIHLAFHMDAEKFDAVLKQIQSAAITYGNDVFDPENMQVPTKPPS